MSTRERKRYEFRREHPTEQRALLSRLKGETADETPEERRIVDEAIEELGRLIESRQRRRRLPSERTARKAQRSLFRRSAPLLPRHKKEK